MKQINTWYHNMSIRYKVVILIYLSVIIVAIVLSGFTLYASRRLIHEQVGNSNLDVVRQVNSNMDFFLQDMVDISTFFFLEPSVQKLLKEGVQREIYSLPVSNLTINLLTTKSFINNLLIYSLDGTPLSYVSTDQKGSPYPQREQYKSPSFDSAIEARGKPVWDALSEQDQGLMYNDRTSKIVLWRAITDFDTSRIIGVLCIATNTSNLEERVLSQIEGRKTDTVIIGDNEGQIHLSKGDGMKNIVNNMDGLINLTTSKDGFHSTKIDGEDILLSYSSFSNIHWTTYYITKTSSIAFGLTSLAQLALVILILFVVILLPILLFISSFLTRPIKTLTKSIKTFKEGDFSAKVDFNNSDEIGMLGQMFNSMVVEINLLIDKTLLLQIREREAELNALQEQINPHFLYNMLDAIHWKAVKSKQSDIADMACSLGMLFRIRLNRGQGKTTVENEKELIEHYLRLQKIRHKETLVYDIHFSDDILDIEIPKLIIQPFVENAVIHGIEKCEKGGIVSISGFMKGNDLHFIICDSGVGTSEEKLGQIKTGEVPYSSYNGGFGIKNVMDRMKIVFGQRFKINIESTYGKGTMVEMVIEDPRRREIKHEA